MGYEKHNHEKWKEKINFNSRIKYRNMKTNRRILLIITLLTIVVTGCKTRSIFEQKTTEEVYELRMKDYRRIFFGKQDDQIKYLSNLESSLNQVSHIYRSGRVMPLEFINDTSSYPDIYSLESGEYTLEQLFERWGTVGFIAMKDNKVFDERYFRGHTADKKWMSFSASKPIIGVLTGIALNDGLIEGLNTPLTDHAPQLKKSAWDGVTYNDALNMTTGIKWDENDNKSLFGLGHAFAMGATYDEWLTTLKRARSLEEKKGVYSSADTQALTAALSGAVNKSIPKYFEEKIWSKIGAEADAFWVVDDSGRAMGLSGWNAILRDYARLGYVYMEGKNWWGEQVIPMSWVKDYQNPTSDNVGSWRQFSVSPDGYGDFAAVGTHGQIIYVNPKTRVVIATQSVNPNYPNEDTTILEQALVFRELSKVL